MKVYTAMRGCIRQKAATWSGVAIMNAVESASDSAAVGAVAHAASGPVAGFFVPGSMMWCP